MFYYGSQYYRPPFPGRECWERDMKNMKALGFTQVKLWAMWNWIEREPGIYTFDELDELVAIAKKNQLKVVINLIPEGAPYWTYTGNTEDLYHRADGGVVLYGGPANIPSGGWPGLCMDCPDFAKRVADFIEATARHFADEEDIYAFDVWNEPHLEPMYDYRDELLCYCEHSKDEFRKWLKARYGTLKALNKSWFRMYTDWSQVTPPPRFGTWADMIDWRTFWLDNLKRWLKIRVDACRRGAPNKKVQTHVAYSAILGNRIVGGLANELGDEFKLAPEVDMFGLSSFPKWLMGREHIYRHLLHNEMISEAAHGKVFYQVELQGGAGKPGLLGGEVPDARDVKLWNWNTILAGGKGSMYWQYAAEPAGIESPGFGLTGFLGENTERSLAAGEMARYFINSGMDNAKKVPAVNAIYVSRKTDVLCFSADKKEEMYAGSLSGVFQAAYRRSIPIRFFHEDFLDELPESGIRFLYLPMLLSISAKEIEAFKRFVEAGGTLVAEAGVGLYSDHGVLNENQAALRELFGLEHREIQGLPDWGDVELFDQENGHVYTGRFYRQVVVPGSDCIVKARFADGEAAITERSAGAGKAVWIGSYLGYPYEKKHEKSTGELLTSYMNPAGYEALESIEVSAAESDLPLAPVVRLLADGEKRFLLVVNHTEKPAEIRVKAKGESKCFTIHLEASEGTVISF